MTVSSGEEACRYYIKKHGRINEPYIPTEEDFPIAEDEGDIYVSDTKT